MYVNVKWSGHSELGKKSIWVPISFPSLFRNVQSESTIDTHKKHLSGFPAGGWTQCQLHIARVRSNSTERPQVLWVPSRPFDLSIELRDTATLRGPQQVTLQCLEGMFYTFHTHALNAKDRDHSPPSTAAGAPRRTPSTTDLGATPAALARGSGPRSPPWHRHKVIKSKVLQCGAPQL